MTAANGNKTFEVITNSIKSNLVGGHKVKF